MGQGDTDGIDSNGDIYINGGTIDITGQSTIDYDGTAVKNGGTLIINGVTTDTIPNQIMGGRGGGMQGDPNGNAGQGNMQEPGNMPGFDRGNMQGFDPENMPEDFDPENMPGSGNRRDRGSDGRTADGDSVYNDEKNTF